MCVIVIFRLFVAEMKRTGKTLFLVDEPFAAPLTIASLCRYCLEFCGLHMNIPS